MEISSFVPSLMALATAAVFVNSAPPQPTFPAFDFDFAANAMQAACAGRGDCAGRRYPAAPAKPMAFPQITNRNEDMSDCPVRTQSRINGFCQCPREYPKQSSGFCCTYDLDGVKICKCPPGYVFRRNTRKICHKMNTRDYTIMVNGVSTCQDENLKTKDGSHCCILTEQRKRLCHCPKGKTYDHVANKCRKSFKIIF